MFIFAVFIKILMQWEVQERAQKFYNLRKYRRLKNLANLDFRSGCENSQPHCSCYTEELKPMHCALFGLFVNIYIYIYYKKIKKIVFENNFYFILFIFQKK